MPVAVEARPCQGPVVQREHPDVAAFDRVEVEQEAAAVGREHGGVEVPPLADRRTGGAGAVHELERRRFFGDVGHVAVGRHRELGHGGPGDGDVRGDGDGRPRHPAGVPVEGSGLERAVHAGRRPGSPRRRGRPRPAWPAAGSRRCSRGPPATPARRCCRAVPARPTRSARPAGSGSTDSGSPPTAEPPSLPRPARPPPTWSTTRCRQPPSRRRSTRSTPRSPGPAAPACRLPAAAAASGSFRPASPPVTCRPARRWDCRGRARPGSATAFRRPATAAPAA